MQMGSEYGFIITSSPYRRHFNRLIQIEDAMQSKIHALCTMHECTLHTIWKKLIVNRLQLPNPSIMNNSQFTARVHWSHASFEIRMHVNVGMFACCIIGNTNNNDLERIHSFIRSDDARRYSATFADNMKCNIHLECNEFIYWQHELVKTTDQSKIVHNIWCNPF